jgi:DNA repair exonuclease SbcCD ATPase subunit
VAFIDTPGFDDTHRTDAQILELVGTWFGKSYSDGFKIHGIVYLHRITDNRMQGTSYKNLRMFQKLVGEESLENVILGTTTWDLVTTEEGSSRESQLIEQYWADLTKFGMQVRRVNTPEAYMSLAIDVTKNICPKPLMIQKELVDENKTFGETLAGEEILSEIKQATEETKAELKEVTEELRQTKESSERNAQDLRKMMEDTERQLNGRLEQAEQDRRTLENDMGKLREEHELERQRQETEREKQRQEFKLERERLERDRSTGRYDSTEHYDMCCCDACMRIFDAKMQLQETQNELNRMRMQRVVDDSSDDECIIQ